MASAAKYNLMRGREIASKRGMPPSFIFSVNSRIHSVGGKANDLSMRLEPPLSLDESKLYTARLLFASIPNTVLNVSTAKANDTFRISLNGTDYLTFTLPPGIYDEVTINNAMASLFQLSGYYEVDVDNNYIYPFSYRPNTTTGYSYLTMHSFTDQKSVAYDYADYIVDFTNIGTSTLGTMIGFTTVLDAGDEIYIANQQADFFGRDGSFNIQLVDAHIMNSFSLTGYTSSDVIYASKMGTPWALSTFPKGTGDANFRPILGRWRLNEIHLVVKNMFDEEMTFVGNTDDSVIQIVIQIEEIQSLPSLY